MFRPLGNKVLVKLEEIKSQSNGGIIIPEEYRTRDKMTKGMVIEIGKDCVDVKQGDFVMLSKHKGSDITINKEPHTLISEADIDGVLYE